MYTDTCPSDDAVPCVLGCAPLYQVPGRLSGLLPRLARSCPSKRTRIGQAASLSLRHAQAPGKAGSNVIYPYSVNRP
jgi:hypothetical protein